MREIKLLDIGTIYDDPERTITVSHGEKVERVTAKLVKDTDYLQEWNFYAFGEHRKMYAELRYEKGSGTILCWGVRK